MKINKKINEVMKFINKADDLNDSFKGDERWDIFSYELEDLLEEVMNLLISQIDKES